MAESVGYLPFAIWSNYKWSEVIAVENADGTAFDLTGYTIEAQVRETADPNSPLIKAITITHDDAGGNMTLVQDNSTTYVTQPRGHTTIVFTASGGTPAPWASGPVIYEKHPTVPA